MCVLWALPTMSWLVSLGTHGCIMYEGPTSDIICPQYLTLLALSFIMHVRYNEANCILVRLSDSSICGLRDRNATRFYITTLITYNLKIGTIIEI